MSNVDQRIFNDILREIFNEVFMGKETYESGVNILLENGNKLLAENADELVTE